MLLCHNPYFSRWFSAILYTLIKNENDKGHNPYFSRWFSAIKDSTIQITPVMMSQSLF